MTASRSRPTFRRRRTDSARHQPSFQIASVETQVAERFPQTDYDRTVCLAVEPVPRTFSLTLLGEGLFLLGGTGVFLSLYAALAGLPTGILREPLAALSNHRRLSWSVHLIYFGLYLLVAAALLVYRPDLPERRSGHRSVRDERRGRYSAFRWHRLPQRQHSRGPPS